MLVERECEIALHSTARNAAILRTPMPDLLTQRQPGHLPQRCTPPWTASLRRALHHTLARRFGAGVALALARCASLPHDPPRVVTTALPASTQTELDAGRNA